MYKPCPLCNKKKPHYHKGCNEPASFRTLKNWIEEHRAVWIFLLAVTGFILGFGENYLLGGSLRQGFIMSFTYVALLIVCELTMGGSGY